MKKILLSIVVIFSIMITFSQSRQYNLDLKKFKKEQGGIITFHDSLTKEENLLVYENGKAIIRHITKDSLHGFFMYRTMKEKNFVFDKEKKAILEEEDSPWKIKEEVIFNYSILFFIGFIFVIVYKIRNIKDLQSPILDANLMGSAGMMRFLLLVFLSVFILRIYPHSYNGTDFIIIKIFIYISYFRMFLHVIFNITSLYDEKIVGEGFITSVSLLFLIGLIFYVENPILKVIFILLSITKVTYIILLKIKDI